MCRVKASASPGILRRRNETGEIVRLVSDLAITAEHFRVRPIMSITNFSNLNHVSGLRHPRVRCSPLTHTRKQSNVIRRPSCHSSRGHPRPLSPARRYTLRSPRPSRISHSSPICSAETPLQGQETHSHTRNDDQRCWLDQRNQSHYAWFYGPRAR